MLSALLLQLLGAWPSTAAAPCLREACLPLIAAPHPSVSGLESHCSSTLGGCTWMHLVQICGQQRHGTYSICIRRIIPRHQLTHLSVQLLSPAIKKACIHNTSQHIINSSLSPLTISSLVSKACCWCSGLGRRQLACGGSPGSSSALTRGRRLASSGSSSGSALAGRLAGCRRLAGSSSSSALAGCLAGCRRLASKRCCYAHVVIQFAWCELHRHQA